MNLGSLWSICRNLEFVSYVCFGERKLLVPEAGFGVGRGGCGVQSPGGKWEDLTQGTAQQPYDTFFFFLAF